MYRLLALFAAGCGLYTGSQPSQDEPSETSYITYKDIPVVEWRHPVDLVFVIDTTPEMAPLHDKLVAQFARLADFIETAGITRDVQIMVITADAADHAALVHDTALHMLSIPAGGYDRNFTGSLADQLTALVPTAFTATASEPIDALVSALANAPAFRHEGAMFMPVIITNHDDGSPGAVDDYFATMQALAGGTFTPAIGLIDGPASPRLERFFADQPEPYGKVDITGDDWTWALQLFEVKVTLGLPCIDAVLVQPYDCAFSAIDGATETVLPACDASGTNRPCAELVSDNASCSTGSHNYVQVSWLAWPEYGTHVTTQCVAETPSN